MTSGLTFGSVCSGIEAASVAWEPLGWRPLWFAEFDKFPSKVLAHHYPGILNVGDMTRIEGAVQDIGVPDVLVGGTPCQSFSLAGARGGLNDDRGALSLSFVRIYHEIRLSKPNAIALWENVPGALSSRDNAFGCILAGLVGADGPIDPGGKWPRQGLVSGPMGGAAWRVLDAKYFGVPQQRRRLFVVAGASVQRCAEILFERTGSPRDSSEGVEEEQDYSCTAASCLGVFGGGGAELTNALTLTTKIRTDFDTENFVVHPDSRDWPKEVAPTLDASYGRLHGQDNQHVDGGCGLYVSNDEYSIAMSIQQDPVSFMDVSPTLVSQPQIGVAQFKGSVVSIFENQRADLTENSEYFCTLSAGGGKPGQGYPAVRSEDRIRRLTPVECERLQGFPDNYTSMLSDTQRYKALGNSMAVPVMRWLGERIQTAMNNEISE